MLRNIRDDREVEARYRARRGAAACWVSGLRAAARGFFGAWGSDDYLSLRVGGGDGESESGFKMEIPAR
jgi:hypothetical protein